MIPFAAQSCSIPLREKWEWESAMRFGSPWVTAVELEFHHIMLMAGPGAEDAQRRGPFPSDAVNLPNDCRSGFLVCLADGSPVHCHWCMDHKVFKRMGDNEPVVCSNVRAWAALPFPVAAA